jgi:serine/threonine-protein kinase ULK/ATG1
MSTFLIKDYVVSRKRIGKGSFSTIYKAFRTKDNREYAIKEIIIDKKSIKSIVKREFLVLKKLDHPNIVKLHDLIIDTSYNNIYFVFDYFKMGDLAKYLNNKPLKEKYCKKYSNQLATGLKYLYDNNILHRDLKPQNILLTDDLNIKIADFGFARKVDKNMLLNTLCGSPMYMAPEIINKQDYSIKSDLWSVGIIIYQMIYGHVPFEVTNFVQLIKKINSEQINYEDPNIRISTECLELIQNLLQVEVDNRISWEDFFYNVWFAEDEYLLEENNLLDFSISNENSVPKLNNFKHHIGENQFASFMHKSIKELGEDGVLNNEINDIGINDIEINFLDSLDNSNYDHYNSNEDYESCESDEEDEQNQNLSHDDNLEHNYFTRSKVKHEATFTAPIEIPKTRNQYRTLNNDPILIDNDYEFIDLNIERQSEPAKQKTITESFKEYLNSSVTLLKHSYKYITNNRSI